MKFLSYKEKRQHGTINFPIAYYRLSKESPRYKMILHWHFENEIIRIVSGKMDFLIDGEIYNTSEGDVLFLPGEVLHSGTPYDCIYEAIVFNPKKILRCNECSNKILAELFSHEKQINIRVDISDCILKEIIDILFCSMRDKNPGYDLASEGAILFILGELIEKHMYKDMNGAIFYNSIKKQQFKNILQFIEKNYNEDINLSQLAAIVDMDQKYFCSFFHEITGRPPIDYLNYYRIECACEQLTTNSLPITNVAYNCGFHDLSYFSKTFKKYKKMTPRDYIKTFKIK